MKNYFLRIVKPELWITIIFVLLIALIVLIVGLDLMQKKRIDNALNEAKKIVTEVALSLAAENIIDPVMVSPLFLEKKSNDIAKITVYPNNIIEVYLYKSFINNIEEKFIFHFESVDGLARGHLGCTGGSVSNYILPNQCRK